MNTATADASDEPIVLVVDDEDATRGAVRRALVDEATVLTAASATQALEILSTQPVWLVTSDQRMPGTTGCELLMHIVARHPDVVRILLSGYADVDTVRDAINAGGIYHCLTKPWETRELRQVVRRGIERYRGERERRQLMRDLETACARLQREAERRARLLTLTTHELGTPLHIVLNALDLAASLDAPQADEWMRTARRASMWLTRVLRQVTTAARLEAPRLRLQRETVDLVSLVDGLCARVRQIMGSRAVTVQRDHGGLGPALVMEIQTDRHWVEHAVWNLLTNAVRFTPDGGAVRIVLEREGTTVGLTVHDTGTGIAPEHLGDLFEPFPAATGNALLHTSGVLEFGTRGVGLGLAAVKRIMDALGGAVRVSSVPQRGSAFTLVLPTVSAAWRKDARPPVPHPGDGAH